jgi:DNA-binding NtrC family response regulator
MAEILIVDDEAFFLKIMQENLLSLGYENLTPISDPAAVQAALQSHIYDAAFLDINMPGMDGLQLLEQVKQSSPQTECIMVTSNEEIPSVIKAIKLGAYDYLVKPVSADQLERALDRALERKRMMEIHFLRQEKSFNEALDQPEAFTEIVTSDQTMLRLLHEAELHARSDIPVLISGETGTGKELMARSLHKASRRSKGPFVAVNMLSLSASLFESEFFGHAKGAFTGAVGEKKGYLGEAAQGTLFLDEIGDLPMDIQGKLLRILQEGEYTPVGKTTPLRADVRFVAATNQDLDALVAEGRFRKDLYYRLRFAQLHLPPLRQRLDDVRILAGRFLEKSSRPQAKLTSAAESSLIGHDWPGNVRELKGVIEAAANLAEKGEIKHDYLNLPPSELIAPVTQSGDQALEPLAEVERRHILMVYKAMNDNKTQAAHQLGISLATLQRKLKAYQVK